MNLQLFWVRDPDYDGIDIDCADAYYAAHDASHAYELWINELPEEQMDELPKTIEVYRLMPFVEAGRADWAVAKRFHPSKEPKW